MGRNNENVKKAKDQGYDKTYKQLKSWGLNFHNLNLENHPLIFTLMIKIFFLKKLASKF